MTNTPSERSADKTEEANASDTATSLLSYAGSICTNNHCENPQCYTADQDDIKTLCTDYLSLSERHLDLLKRHEELVKAVRDVTERCDFTDFGGEAQDAFGEMQQIIDDLDQPPQADAEDGK